MGWTYQRAIFYDRRGGIDRKAECDALYTWHNEETGDRCRVLKSAMVGSTWYRSLRTDETESGSVCFRRRLPDPCLLQRVLQLWF